MKLILLIISSAILMYGCGNGKSSGTDFSGSTVQTYQEQVQSVGDIERSNPTNFLSAKATYRQNFFGDKIKIDGTITNTATTATFKDAVVNITYYSKTKTVLGQNSYTIYDYFPPNSTKNFKLKIDNYQDVNSIGLDVTSAVAN